MKKKVQVLITGTYELDDRDISESTFARQLTKDRKEEPDGILGLCGDNIKMTLSWADDK